MVGGPAIFFFFSDGVEGRSNPDPTSVFEIPLTAPRLFKVVIHDAHCMHRAGRHAKPAETLASAKRGEQRRKAMVSSSRARTRWPTNAFVAILLLAILVSLSGTSSCAHSDEKRSLSWTVDCRFLWRNPQKGLQDPGSWIQGGWEDEIWDGNRQLRRNKEQTARTKLRRACPTIRKNESTGGPCGCHALSRRSDGIPSAFWTHGGVWQVIA